MVTCSQCHRGWVTGGDRCGLCRSRILRVFADPNPRRFFNNFGWVPPRLADCLRMSERACIVRNA